MLVYYIHEYEEGLIFKHVLKSTLKNLMLNARIERFDFYALVRLIFFTILKFLTVNMIDLSYIP